jgi:hypothetical protein
MHGVTRTTMSILVRIYNNNSNNVVGPFFRVVSRKLLVACSWELEDYHPSLLVMLFMPCKIRIQMKILRFTSVVDVSVRFISKRTSGTMFYSNSSPHAFPYF